MRKVGATTGLVLLLVVSGLALPAHSQEEPQRWPYFEAESRIDPPPGAQNFGHHVATDGQRVLAAAQDAAYLDGRDQNRWVLRQSLAPTSDGPVRAVALADDHAVVSTAGSLHVWERGGDGAWSAHQEFAGPSTLGEALLARDGWLFASAPRTDTLGDLGQDGELHAYQLQNGRYVHKQVLAEPTDTVQRVFGADVAMRDGVLVVGAPARTLTEQVAPGAAFLYEREGSRWVLRDAVEAGAGDAQSSFGHRVATTGTAVAVSASDTFFGQTDGRGWVTFYERGETGWRAVQEESTDASAVAARDDVLLTVEWYWGYVGVWMRESEQLDCWRGPWCTVGVLGGWNWYYGETPVPTAIAIEDRVAVVGAPDEPVDGARSGVVLAYYDNFLPRAIPLPNEPVDDVDGDGRESVTLDASHSWDLDGEIVAYQWSRGGKVVSTEPCHDVDLPLGTHAFELEVTDDLGGVGRATLHVVVQVPQLSLSIDYCCAFFGREARLDRPTYFWADVHDHRAGAKHWDWDFDGDGETDSTEVHPTHVFPHGGTWPVTLTVTNEAGDTLTATRDVVVENRAPDADAGPAQVVVVDLVGTTTATLDAGRTVDADGTVERFDWLQRDPVAGTYSTAASGSTAEVQVTRGVNHFRLWAIDDDGDRGLAETLVVAIAPGQNQTSGAPTADFTHEVRGRDVLLEDASTPGDADIVAVMWGTNETNRVVGNAGHVLSFEDAGEHQIHQIVVDADGRVRERVRTVTIPDAPPQLGAWPLAGTVPVGEHGVFYGVVADEAPDRVAWQWRIDGAVVSDHQDFGHTFTTVGNHTVQVQVTDDHGHVATLEGWMEVVTQEEFRERFQEVPGRGDDGDGPDDVFEGDLEEPDEAIREELERRRDPQDGGDGESGRDDGDEDDDADGRAPLLSAEAPAPPTVGSVPYWVWAIASLGALLLALLAVEVRRHVRRARRRRERYEAAVQARLATQRRRPG